MPNRFRDSRRLTTHRNALSEADENLEKRAARRRIQIQWLNRFLDQMIQFSESTLMVGHVSISRPPHPALAGY